MGGDRTHRVGCVDGKCIACSVICSRERTGGAVGARALEQGVHPSLSREPDTLLIVTTLGPELSLGEVFHLTVADPLPVREPKKAAQASKSGPLLAPRVLERRYAWILNEPVRTTTQSRILSLVRPPLVGGHRQVTTT